MLFDMLYLLSTVAISPTNNIVLRSPVLSPARKSTSPEECEQQPVENGFLPGKETRDDSDRQVVFQYKTHDVHEFHLKTNGYSEKGWFLLYSFVSSF